MRPSFFCIPEELVKHYYPRKDTYVDDRISYFNRVDESGSMIESGIEVSIPGVPKENVNISIEGSKLSINVESVPQSQDKIVYVGDTKPLAGKGISASYTIPNTYNLSKVRASVENGILRIVIPVSDKSKVRTVKID